MAHLDQILTQSTPRLTRSRSENTKWFTNKRRRGDLEPVGPFCATCGSTAKSAYNTMETDAIVDSIKTSAEFRTGFQKATSIRTGAANADFRRQKVECKKLCGFKIINKYMVLTIDEFIKEYDMTPKEAGLTIDSLPDEEGSTMQCIVLADTGRPHTYRVAEVWHSTQEVLEETYAAPDQQCRKDQGSDVHEWLTKEKQKSRCPRLKKGTRTLTPAEVSEKVAEAKSKKKNEDAGGDGKAADEDMSDADDSESLSSELVEEEGSFGPALDIDDANGGKKRRRAKGAGKGKNQTPNKATARCSEAATTLSVVSGESPAICGSDKLISNVAHHTQLIDLTSILTGARKGDDIYQARRTLKGLERRGEEGAATILLRSHLALADVAKACNPMNIRSLSVESRNSNFRKLKAEGVKIPVVLQASLIAIYVKELNMKAHASNDGGVWDKFAACLLPAELSKSKPPPKDGAHAIFDPILPTLANSELSPNDTIKLWQRCIVEDILIPVVCEGEASETKLLALCTFLAKMFAPMADADLPPMMEACATEMLEVFNNIRGVCSTLPIPGISISDVKAFLDQSVQQTAQKNIVLKALQQQPHYDNRMTSYIKHSAAMTLHGAAVVKAQQKLEEGTPADSDLRDIGANFCVWKAELPPESCERVTTLLLQHLEDEHRIIEQGSESPTKELHSRCKAATALAESIVPAMRQDFQFVEIRTKINATQTNIFNAMQGNIIIDGIVKATTETNASVCTELLSNLETACASALTAQQAAQIVQFFEAVVSTILGTMGAFADMKEWEWPDEKMKGFSIMLGAATRVGDIFKAEENASTDDFLDAYGAVAMAQKAMSMMAFCAALEEGDPKTVQLLEQLSAAAQMYKESASQVGKNSGKRTKSVAETFKALEGMLGDVQKRSAQEFFSQARDFIETSLADLQEVAAGGTQKEQTWLDGIEGDPGSFQDLLAHAKKTLLSDGPRAKHFTTKYNSLKKAVSGWDPWGVLPICFLLTGTAIHNNFPPPKLDFASSRRNPNMFEFGLVCRSQRPGKVRTRQQGPTQGPTKSLDKREKVETVRTAPIKAAHGCSTFAWCGECPHTRQKHEQQDTIMAA